jgi:hypothetical protein
VDALHRAENLGGYDDWGYAWIQPWILCSLASAHEKAGQDAEARARVDELLALWRDADPDLPLSVEARALRRRLEGPRVAAEGRSAARPDARP